MLKLPLPLLVPSMPFWGSGCSNSATDPNRGTEFPNLNDQFGGFTTSDDLYLPAPVNNDENYEDLILRLAEVDTLLADDESGLYRLRIVWGRLCLDTTVTEATDWSGSLFVNKGAEIIRRVIRFEPDQDYFHPLIDRNLIDWISRTSIHNDGIAVDIVIDRPEPVLDSTTVIETVTESDTAVTILVDTAYPVLDPVEVVFEAGPYSSTFTLAEISALDSCICFDDSNAVAINGVKLDNFSDNTEENF